MILGVGLALGRLPRFAGAESALTAFVFYVALPCFLFDSLAGAAPAGSGGIPTVVVVAAVLAAVVVAVLAAIPGARGGARGSGTELALAAGYGNTGYLGIPVTVGLLGDDAALAAGVVQLAHNVVFMLGYPIVAASRRGSSGSNDGLATTVWQTTRSAVLLNPVTISVVAGLLVAQLGVSLPAVLATTVEMLAGAAVPAALIAVGLTLGPSLRALTSGGVHAPAVIVVVVAKLLAVPVVTWLVLEVLAPSLEPLWAGALVLMAAMPTSTTAFVLAREYGGDGRPAAATIAATTLASLLTIPVMVALFVPGL
ncbi:AEC family transporter [Georgenia halophila]|uniref:AEC family transporter n=1 Tax=Georgenia halophila TaxID=620889 RepID=A0ABP8L6N6_9MICO